MCLWYMCGFVLCRYLWFDCVVCPWCESLCFVFVLCLEGEGSIFYNGEMHSVRRGDGYYLPAGMGDLRLEGNMVLLQRCLAHSKQ